MLFYRLFETIPERSLFCEGLHGQCLFHPCVHLLSVDMAADTASTALLQTFREDVLSLPREKIPHDPAENGYSQDNGAYDSEENGKKQGQLKNKKEERKENHAYDYRQAACGKILCFQHSAVLPVAPFPGNLGNLL